MSVLDAALEDAGYVLWVQAGTCIGFAKKGLESFVFQRSQVLHQRIKYNVKDTSSFTNMCPNISIEKTKNNWKMSCYPNCPDCQIYLNELLSLCAPGFKFEKSNWENSNINIWPVSNWEIAKVYMNAGQDKTGQTPQDADLSGILNFIEHCAVPYLAVSETGRRNRIIKKVRDGRNAIMHSSTFTVTQQDFQNFTDSMIQLLEDQTSLLYENGAKDAVSKIKEAKGSNFTITTDAEFRVLRDRALELQKENRSMQENVNQMQDQCDELEGKDDEESQTTLAQLVKDIEEKENDLKELESTFNKLASFASRKQDLNTKMETHTTSTSTALRVTKEMLSKVRNSYRVLTKQEQDIIEDATDQYETFEEKYKALEKLTEGIITENNDMKAQMDALNTSKTESETRSKYLQGELDELKQEFQDIKKDYEVILERADLLKEKLDTTKLEQDTTESELKKLREENSELIDVKIKELEQQNAQFEKDLLNIQTKHDTDLKELNRLNDENKNLKLQIDELNENITKTLQKNDANLKEIGKLSGINHELELKREKLQEEINNIVREILSVKSEIKDLNMRLTELNHKISDMEKEKESIENENVSLQSQVNWLRAEQKTAKATNKTLVTELQLMKSLNSKFKTDFDAVSGLKQQNDNLKRTDTTLLRIWCLSLILYVIVFVIVYWDEVLQM